MEGNAQQIASAVEGAVDRLQEGPAEEILASGKMLAHRLAPRVQLSHLTFRMLPQGLLQTCSSKLRNTLVLPPLKALCARCEENIVH